jgi:hypothetical protein
MRVFASGLYRACLAATTMGRLATHRDTPPPLTKCKFFTIYESLRQSNVESKILFQML